ncbi:MAG TPA: S-layer homology domain-containing protein [Acidimicrobiia bacterium]|nr:S-layer homology domain-containing protein [Acidimicrobiia bacterium]
MLVVNEGEPNRGNGFGSTPTAIIRRLVIVVLCAIAWITLSTAAVADTTALRSFEDEVWDSPPSQVEEVEERLGLVDLRSIDLSRTRLSGNGYVGKSLAVGIPSGGFRGFGPFDRLQPSEEPAQAPTEAWFRYHIRLIDWNAASTGKLPGLAGIYSSSGRGCIRPTDTYPGWSARGMFGAPGTQGAPAGRVPIGTYLYHADQAGDCGDGLWWNASLEQGRWHCVEGRVKINTPGKNDGLIRGWLDGDLKIGRNNIQYRRAGETGIGVRQMWHNVYFGGKWPTPNPLSLEYDEVSVSTLGRVGCLPPFTDIGQTMHAGSIRELHALGYLYGCDYRKACPFRLLTRGEAAAFLSRILELPVASKDYFSDDQGSTFEGVINRLAEARIARGCNPPANDRYCPDQTMIRAEFATMLSRALGLGSSPPDAFSDDDGHWAEEEINRFAAAGLTKGCGDDRFCPERDVPRDEVATFLHRSLGLLKPLNSQSFATTPDWPPQGEPPPIPVEEQD